MKRLLIAVALLAPVLCCAGVLMLSGGRGTASTGGGDFATRCAAAGVLKCVDFDADDDFTTGLGGTNGAWGGSFGVMPQDGTSNYYVTRDTSVKASGTSSLRFDIPAASPQNGNVGAWFTRLKDDNSVLIGEGQELYVQWRQRIDQNILDTTYVANDGTSLAAGIKLADISAGDRPTCMLGSGDSQLCPTTCWDFEVVLQNIDQFELARMYANCAGPQAYHQMMGVTSNFTVQNGVGCLYPDYTAPPCVRLAGNEWLTFQIHIAVNAWNTYTNVIQMWMAREGGSSVLLVDCSSTASDKCNDGAGDVDGWYLFNSDTNYKIGKVWLLPYQTNRGTQSQGVATSVWYDDLIISTQPIADPTGAEFEFFPLRAANDERWELAA